MYKGVIERFRSSRVYVGCARRRRRQRQRRRSARKASLSSRPPGGRLKKSPVTNTNSPQCRAAGRFSILLPQNKGQRLQIASGYCKDVLSTCIKSRNENFYSMWLLFVSMFATYLHGFTILWLKKKKKKTQLNESS